MDENWGVPPWIVEIQTKSWEKRTVNWCRISLHDPQYGEYDLNNG